MRLLNAGVILVLSGCAIAPPRPSMWQLESQCSAANPVAQIEQCTRNGLDSSYGDAWHSAPQADQFLAYIGVAAEHVNAGAITEAHARYAISSYAARAQQQAGAIEAQQEAAQARLGIALLEASGPTTMPLTTDQRIAIAMQAAQNGAPVQMPQAQPMVLPMPLTPRAPLPPIQGPTFTPLPTQPATTPIQCQTAAVGGQLMTNCTGGN